MTATERVGYGHPDRHPLAPGATSEAIRGHLLVEDRPLFDAALAEATEQTRDDGDRAVLPDTLEEWRCRAIAQRDRETFVRTARRIAEHNTGEASPPEEPLGVTRAKAGM